MDHAAIYSSIQSFRPASNQSTNLIRTGPYLKSAVGMDLQLASVSMVTLESIDLNKGNMVTIAPFSGNTFSQNCSLVVCESSMRWRS
jgi:hypothetical protein